jgi:hypothetical protein
LLISAIVGGGVNVQTNGTEYIGMIYSQICYGRRMIPIIGRKYHQSNTTHRLVNIKINKIKGEKNHVKQ